MTHTASRRRLPEYGAIRLTQSNRSRKRSPPNQATFVQTPTADPARGGGGFLTFKRQAPLPTGKLSQIPGEAEQGRPSTNRRPREAEQTVACEAADGGAGEGEDGEEAAAARRSVRGRIASLRGSLVLLPLEFLADEPALLPRISDAKEFLAPAVTFV